MKHNAEKDRWLVEVTISEKQSEGVREIKELSLK